MNYISSVLTSHNFDSYVHTDDRDQHTHHIARNNERALKVKYLASDIFPMIGSFLKWKDFSAYTHAFSQSSRYNDIDERTLLRFTIETDGKILSRISRSVRNISDFVSSCLFLGLDSTALPLPLIDEYRAQGNMDAYNSEPLREDFEFMSLAIQKNPRNIRYASRALKQDPEFMLQTYKRAPFDTMRHAPRVLKNNQQFMLEIFAEDSAAMGYFPMRLLSNRQFMLQCLEIDAARTVAHAPPRLKENIGFMLKALKLTSVRSRFLPKSLKENPYFFLKAIAVNPHLISAYEPSCWEDEKQFLKKAVTISKAAVFYYGLSRVSKAITDRLLQN